MIGHTKIVLILYFFIFEIVQQNSNRNENNELGGIINISLTNRSPNCND